MRFSSARRRSFGRCPFPVAKKNEKNPQFERFEEECFDSGYDLVAGIDEAGRGALAGPLSVGIAMFKREFFAAPLPVELTRVNDSKLLAPAEREALYELVKSSAEFQAVIHVSNRIIDKIGINPATELAVLHACRRAERSGKLPQMLLIDGNYKLRRLSRERPQTEYRSIVRGDSRVFSIAAASILAKVSRDRRMRAYARYYPEYEFDKHKGYGTRLHQDRLEEVGPGRLHRQYYLLKMSADSEDQPCLFPE